MGVGVGFNDGIDPNAAIYLANSTPANTAANLITQTNDTIRALPSTPKWTTQIQELSTGLVAHQGDADSLCLINQKSTEHSCRGKQPRSIPRSLQKICRSICQASSPRACTLCQTYEQPLQPTQPRPPSQHKIAPTAESCYHTDCLRHSCHARTGTNEHHNQRAHHGKQRSRDCTRAGNLERCCLDNHRKSPINEAGEQAIAYVKHPSPIKTWSKPAIQLNPKPRPLLSL